MPCFVCLAINVVLLASFHYDEGHVDALLVGHLVRYTIRVLRVYPRALANGARVRCFVVTGGHKCMLCVWQHCGRRR